MEFLRTPVIRQQILAMNVVFDVSVDPNRGVELREVG
jgi:hypothetical protein